MCTDQLENRIYWLNSLYITLTLGQFVTWLLTIIDIHSIKQTQD